MMQTQPFLTIWVNPRSLQSIKLISVFMAEASTDIVNLLARVYGMACNREVKTIAICLASKHSWCKIPYEVHSLFDDKLEATGYMFDEENAAAFFVKITNVIVTYSVQSFFTERLPSLLFCGPPHQ